MLDQIVPILIGFLSMVLVVGGIVLLLIKNLKPTSSSEKNKDIKTKNEEESRWSWLTHTKLLIVYGLAIFNLVVWAMIPWFWDILAYKWYTWLIFNIGFWTILYFLTVKVKDKDGKETESDHPTAKRLAKIITAMLILGLATITWKYFQEKGWPFGSSNEATITPGFSPQLGGTQAGSVSYTLAVLDGCETGTGAPGSGRHFLEDGITPVRNPQDAPWGTGAVGKWQIHIGDPDVSEELKLLEAEMKLDGSLGPDESLDVERSEAHNRAAAEYLYKKYGTAPWTASVACWGSLVTSTGTLIVTLEAPVGEWSNYFSFPNNHRYDFGRVSPEKEEKYRAEFTTQDGKVILGEFPSEEFLRVPKAIKMRVQSLEKEPVIIKITLTPKS